nr:MAG TPA: hypothetical protein [Caudoviricetes sp.]
MLALCRADRLLSPCTLPLLMVKCVCKVSPCKNACLVVAHRQAFF